jgi:hypothetical protein
LHVYVKGCGLPAGSPTSSLKSNSKKPVRLQRRPLPCASPGSAAILPGYFSEPLIEVNLVLSRVPRPLMTAMIASAMPVRSWHLFGPQS